MTKFCNCKWIPFVYSQWLLKILNNTYQFWPVEKCWFWWGKTKLLIVSKLFTVNNKKVSKAWVGTSLSPHPLTFWLTGEIKRYLHSLLYKQVLIVIITLGNSMWPMILCFTNEFLEVRVCIAPNYKNSKLWGLAPLWDLKR